MSNTNFGSISRWIFSFLASAMVLVAASNSVGAAPLTGITVVLTNTSPSKSIEVRVKGTSSRDQTVYFQMVIPPGRSVSTTKIPPGRLLSYRVRQTTGTGEFVGPQLANLTRNTRVSLSPCTTAARWCFNFQYY